MDIWDAGLLLSTVVFIGAVMISHSIDGVVHALDNIHVSIRIKGPTEKGDYEGKSRED